MEFSSRLKEIVDTRHITQTELSKRMECSVSVISRYLSGQREPSLSVLAEFARVLEVTSDYLLGLSDEPTARVEKITETVILEKVVEVPTKVHTPKQLKPL